MTSSDAPIEVTVILHSILRHRNGQIVNRLTLSISPGSQVQDVLTILEIDPRLEPLLAVGAELARPDTELQNGDELAIIPSVSGG